jgi:hypothetical protein
MLSAAFADALSILAERFQKHRIRWAVIGSANQALQGIDVMPKDLDIVVQIDVSEIAHAHAPGFSPRDKRERFPSTLKNRTLYGAMAAIAARRPL